MVSRHWAFRSRLWVTAMVLTAACSERETPSPAVERTDGAWQASAKVANHDPTLAVPSSSAAPPNTNVARVPSATGNASLVVSVSTAPVRPAVNASKPPVDGESLARPSGISSTKTAQAVASGYYRCCDGTTSTSCRCGGSKRGCCSRHGGVCGC